MNRRLAVFVLTPFAICWLAAGGPQDPKADEQDRTAVTKAALNYVDALYEAKPELIAESVHAKLTKFGFYRSAASKPYEGHAMSYEQLAKLAKSWNRNGNKVDASSPRKVEVLDLLDQTAVVKLTAVWGIDYMHLAKYEGQWKIVHILWQSHPKQAPADDQPEAKKR